MSTNVKYKLYYILAVVIFSLLVGYSKLQYEDIVTILVISIITIALLLLVTFFLEYYDGYSIKNEDAIASNNQAVAIYYGLKFIGISYLIGQCVLAFVEFHR